MRCILFALWFWSTCPGMLPTAVAATANIRAAPDRLYERMAEFVRPAGYPLEQRFVTTSDGYILRLFRIPHGREGPHERVPQQQQQQQQSSQQSSQPAQQYAQPQKPARRLSRGGKERGSTPGSTRRLSQARGTATTGGGSTRQATGHKATGHAAGMGLQQRPVVYMQHALLDSSVDYVFLGPGKGLAFLLADAGYDVWLGNIRGNTFSRNHSALHPDQQEKFWEFSFDEHALIDLPAMVDTMLETTGADSFVYVGYSQGTVMAFAALSSLPDFAAKIRVAVLMAPIAFITHSTALGVQLAAHADTDKIYELLGIGEWLGHGGILSLFLSSICRLEPTPCILAMGSIGGFNPSNIDPSILPLLFQYLPSGTSVQNAAHWSQAIRATNESRFVRYDYGTSCVSPMTGVHQRCNQEKYGQADPPEYHLSAITTKLALFTGGEDMLADPRDSQLLLEALPPSSVVYVHHEPSYSHWDFGFGSNVHERVFPRVLEVIRNYTRTYDVVN